MGGKGTSHPASPEARAEIVIGVVGGSGLYEMEGLTEVESIALSTPFGEPSDTYTCGRLERSNGELIKLVFLPRHGRGHRRMPSEVNYRANIHGLKQLGVTHMLAVSAVGSLQEAIEPGHFVIPDQLIDRTKNRVSTFFGEGVVGHVQFGDPVCPLFSKVLADAADGQGTKVHRGGSCIVMEGPAFSTRAESELYRSWGAQIIGMTALPEAKLAREAEMAYAQLAMATDYDCWHQGEEEVSVEAVIEIMKANVGRARATVRALAEKMPVKSSEMPYPRACEFAVMTAPDQISDETRQRMELIIGHYL